jgi:hypothetical protein
MTFVLSACGEVENVNVYLPLSMVNDVRQSSWKCEIDGKNVYLKFNVAGSVTYYENTIYYGQDIRYSVAGDKMTWVYSQGSVHGIDDFGDLFKNHWGVTSIVTPANDKVGISRQITFTIKRVDDTHLKIGTNTFVAEFD